MKKLLIILFLFPQILMAQSPDCIGAEPFCTGTSVSFPAATNTSSLFFINTLPIKFNTPTLKPLLVSKISKPFPGLGLIKLYGLKSFFSFEIY